jgi:hypothetical protein
LFSLEFFFLDFEERNTKFMRIFWDFYGGFGEMKIYKKNRQFWGNLHVISSDYKKIKTHIHHKKILGICEQIFSTKKNSNSNVSVCCFLCQLFRDFHSTIFDLKSSSPLFSFINFTWRFF